MARKKEQSKEDPKKAPEWEKLYKLIGKKVKKR